MKVARLKEPKRKRIIWPWIVIGSLTLLIVAPIAVTAIMAYDDASKKIVIQPDADFKTIGNRVIVDSLDNSVSKQVMEVNVTENDVDNLLHLAMQQITASNRFIKKAYVKIKGTQYKFYVDVQASFYKSRICLTTALTETEDHNAFLFKIKDISIGHISGISGPLKMLMDKFVTEESINNVIKNAKLSMVYNKADFTITYQKTDLVKDLSNLTGQNDMGLYFDIIKTMVEDRIFDFNLESDNFLEGVVDLTKLETNEYVTDDHIKVQPEQVTENCKDKLLTLIDNGNIDPKTDDLQLMFSFLFGGWASLDASEQAIIAQKDFSYVDITDVTTYKGFDLIHSEDKITDKMAATVKPEKLIDKTLDPRYKDLCDLSEEAINDYIAGRNIVGYTTILSRYDGDDYKLNYITIDNFYSNIYKKTVGEDIINTAEFVCKVNVNGYHTSLAFVTKMDDDAFMGNKVKFKIIDVQYGSIKADSFKESFYDIIASALNGNGADTSLSINKEQETFIVDFTEIMNIAKTRAEKELFDKTGISVDMASYFQGNNMTFTVNGESREDNGGFHLALINPIDY